MNGIIPELLPGDHCLYRPSSLTGYAIALKTWAPVSHVEIYIGNGQSVASRDGKGVDTYPVRKEGLAYILRPNRRFDLEKGMTWFFNDAHGARYSFGDLWNFFMPFVTIDTQGMICSTFAALFDQHAGFESFNPHWNANKISPADFLKVGCFEWVWWEK